MQKLAIEQEDTERASHGYQNYMIPTDYFRYCAPSCTLQDSMLDFSYKEHIKKF
jgi:hypothetical protein|nr:MAG TPA: hypothetical protein [Bacteriophage sp.]